MTYDLATKIKQIEAELMALKIHSDSGGGELLYSETGDGSTSITSQTFWNADISDYGLGTTYSKIVLDAVAENDYNGTVGCGVYAYDTSGSTITALRVGIQYWGGSFSSVSSIDSSSTGEICYANIGYDQSFSFEVTLLACSEVNYVNYRSTSFGTNMASGESMATSNLYHQNLAGRINAAPADIGSIRFKLASNHAQIRPYYNFHIYGFR